MSNFDNINNKSKHNDIFVVERGIPVKNSNLLKKGSFNAIAKAD